MISVNHSPSSTPCAYTSIPDADGQIAIRGEIMVTLSMCHAGWINLRLRYELMGCADAPVVFVLGGISAHRHIAATARFPEKGWVDGLVGAGRALDPGCFRLLSFDFLGADGQLDVPIDTADQADAIAVLLDRLGITTLYGFVGYSYGALVGLQFAIRHPGRVHRMIVVSGAHRAHPYAAAWRALQRRAVALGQLQCAEHQGLALARQFAMLSYRTPEEFGERFDAAAELINGRVRVAAEDYLDAAGAQYVACTPVNAYLRLSESIDLHRIDPTKVAVPTVVVAVEGDRLVPLSDLVALIEGLGTRGSLRVLRSPYGHDAFLKETNRIDAILTTALRSTGESI
ncbi:homoserine O-succinyltransferase [Xylella taiwanensis]|uniref:Homoserine O-acetyltransferase n=1 Tax=Xylella taiwanensis TaxID=1444770 RepID=Z9JMI9_9GAMM|nr:homoserine O-succinyltransferase [Xylella taiwanensis]AXI84448.1 homoserine acetyltransferase [Xylella taiwanensis]EWS79394.1 homoserine O-acetyltransferase [Xylella taiwanensis]MCD8455345.1 homoserine O-succinyltransferase [Xylella taiwanensis]MCD8457750.1 homoserine O-succinyltransferase [Xylella taiwanensis]MCD8459885.1 homoserine O-succinyltransferase [Xylella taiwanensis]